MDTEDEGELSTIARALDCFTEKELMLLADASPGTVESWRKRGKGPSYILFGNRFLYPRASVADHLKTLIRERSQGSAKEQL